MTTVLILYAATVLIFFALDFIGLTRLIRPLFERELGDALLDQPKLGAAAVFYLFYIAGVVWFVSIGAIDGGDSLGAVFLQGALLGAMAYGTYEFTNMATLKAWTWQMVATDLIWGTLLTGVSAATGVLITRLVTATA